MRMVISYAALLFLILACASLSKHEPQKAKSSTKQLFSEYHKDLAKGKEKAAREKLELVIKQDPQSDLADDAAMALGDLYFKYQEYEKAYDSYMKIVRANIISPNEIDALYLASRCLFFLDRLDEATGLLEKSTKFDALQLEQKLKIHELLAQIKRQQGDDLDALKSYAILSENHSNDERKKDFQQIAKGIIETKLDDKQLETVAGGQDFGILRGDAMLMLADRYASQRAYDKASYYYSTLAELFPNSPSAEKAAQFLKYIDDLRTVDAKTIGVILPLSGKHSETAYKTLRGIQLALGIFNKGERSPYRLAVQDSEGSPEVAKRAVERLVLEDHVIAIIGGLLSRTADAETLTSEQFGVPIIALSQKAGLTDLGESIVRNSLTSEMQIAHLVQTAMDDFGIKRFAILYPNDPYGVEYANLFWDHVLARNGQITAAIPYQSNEKDFQNSIKRLVGTYYIEDRIDEYKTLFKDWQKKNPVKNTRNEIPDDLLPPIVDFEGLFIPDNTTALGQIAPMLKFNDVSNIMLLGTNLWNSKSLISRTQDMAEKTLFVDSLWTSDENFQKNKFSQSFFGTFNSQPGHFEIQSYDAANLLKSVLASGADNRREVLERLIKIDAFPGVAGPLTMSKQREVLQPVVALSVRDQSIKKAYVQKKN